MSELSKLLSNLHDAATPKDWAVLIGTDLKCSIVADSLTDKSGKPPWVARCVTEGFDSLGQPDLSAEDAELIVALRNHTPEIIAALEAVEGYEKRIPVINSALNAIERVRELHVPAWVDSPPPGGLICAACLHPVEDEPCPTIRALDGE